MAADGSASLVRETVASDLSLAPDAGTKWADRISFGLLIVTLAEAPLPFGSNRPWSWSLLCLLIGLSWSLWAASMWKSPSRALATFRLILLPALLTGGALLWALIQILPIVPAQWVHPIWQLADGVLGESQSGVISVNPWRGATELMKLLCYAMAFFLAMVHAQRANRARFLLNALIVIGAVYAFYALILESLNESQFTLFYGLPPVNHGLSGPFINHNNYATYAGLMTLCALVSLVQEGASRVTTNRGLQPLMLTSLQFTFGAGARYLVAFLITASTLIATASRAGNLSTILGMGALLVIMIVLGVRQARVRWVASVSIVVLAVLATLFAINGQFLATRLDDVASSGLEEQLRVMLWDAALRMIAGAPLLGLGLGTYESAFPMYADTMTRFIMDRAHNDFLELAAGLGLPAAFLWLSGMALLFTTCLRGVFNRRRNRGYAMLGIGATVLVAVHSIFDFSLQMPAVAVTYAVILGLAVGQSFRTAVVERANGIAESEPGGRELWIRRTFLAFPAVAIALLAPQRFVDGLAREAAYPVDAYIALNVRLPNESYVGAAKVLSVAPVADGEAAVSRAEAAYLAGQPLGAVLPILASGLRHAPATARGWILMARLLGASDPAKAAASLELALELAPHEYWQAYPRLLAGAQLWAFLTPAAQAVLSDDVRLFASRKDLHPQLRAVLDAPGGPTMVTHAFAGNPDALRALNRELTKERLGL